MRLIAFLPAMMLAACAELTADAPLFSPDQSGPPPIQEGIWIALHGDCTESNTRRQRFPSDCLPLEFARELDGAWRVTVRVDLISDLTREERAEAEAELHGPFRLVLASTVERSTEDAYAPVYLGEVTSHAEVPPTIGYAVIAPIGAPPATEMRILLSIGCSDILRDGPIEGVAPHYETRTLENGEEQTELRSCVASTQAAVREAARRAVIENIDELVERRFVHVRSR